MIGIITFYDGTNYGTTLQALALQKTVCKLGFDNEVINYVPYLENRKIDIIKYRVTHPKAMAGKIYEKILCKKHNRMKDLRAKKFEEFIKNNIVLGKTKYHYNKDFLVNPPKYDGYIVGSDQTWNPYVAGNPDCLYLSFANKSAWKGTYAPSISLDSLNEKQKDRLRQLTEDFEYLSCREESGSQNIRECTGKKVTTVLDPTMLMDTYEWEKYIQATEKPKEYILQYFLGDNKEFRDIVQKIALQLNCEIVTLPYSNLDIKGDGTNYAGPGEFLDLIKNAKLVCTDSFHGTVFSVIFRTPMITFDKHSNDDIKSENSRIHDLLNSLGLNDRLFTSSKSIDFDSLLVLDSERIDSRLKALRDKSLSYLSEMLKNQGRSIKRNNINRYSLNKECYSCFSCEYICPAKAINMKEKNGFFFPNVEIDKCIYCGKCVDNCLIHNNNKRELSGKAYIGYLKDDEKRYKSSSGGIFRALADSMIDRGGYVVGCVYDEFFQPRHVVTNQASMVDRMVGSKYVQSDLDGVYDEIQQLLKDNKQILFCGLPCQVKAASNMFGNNDNIYFVSLVCHGVMPRDIWRRYINEEEELNGKVLSINMRDKRRGWTDYGLHFTFDEDKETIVFRKSNGHLLKCYTDGLFESDRCLSCEIKGNMIISDMVIGDGWSGEMLFPGIDDGKGISEIFTFTTKGESLMKDIADGLKVRECDFATLVEDSPRMWSPENRHVVLNKFRKEISNSSFNLHRDLHKYASPDLVTRGLWKIKLKYKKDNCK